MKRTHRTCSAANRWSGHRPSLDKGEAIRRGQMLEFLAEEQGRGQRLRTGVWPNCGARRVRSGLKPGAGKPRDSKVKRQPD